MSAVIRWPVVYREQSWGGGVKGRTYLYRLPIAYFHQFSKDVPKKENENNRPVILS